jgi:hypothetical protein
VVFFTFCYLFLFFKDPVSPVMSFFEGSVLNVEWDNDPCMGDCNVVLQYMCSPDLRDGNTTQTIPDDATDSQDPLYGMHENYEYYQACSGRSRNQGLFTSTLSVRNDKGARATRQNLNARQNGFECPEERDYYPYWQYSPWRDIAVFTSNTSRCPLYYKNSQNVQAKPLCNATGCSPRNAWNSASPECLPMASSYQWKLPSAPPANYQCVLRIRFNTSSSEVLWDLDAKSNGAASPTQSKPQIPIPGNQGNLTLYLYPQQDGRVYQDRTHSFQILPPPPNVAGTIFNLNVGGKRGNSVQVFPSRTYFFSPSVLHANVGDAVHIQWSGSDFNPIANDGPGTPRTDRFNLVPAGGPGSMYPNFTKSVNVFGWSNFVNNPVGFGLAWLNQTDCGGKACNFLEGAINGYWNAGIIPLIAPGDFYYLCTLNNYISRPQSGVISVTPATDVDAKAKIAIR